MHASPCKWGALHDSLLLGLSSPSLPPCAMRWEESSTSSPDTLHPDYTTHHLSFSLLCRSRQHRRASTATPLELSPPTGIAEFKHFVKSLQQASSLLFISHLDLLIFDSFDTNNRFSVTFD